MFRSSTRNVIKKADVEKPQDVQVEVSLDMFDNLYSIVVTEATRLQSVVSVPTEDGGSRRQHLRKNKTGKNDPEAALMVKLSKAAPTRLADSLRPLSPSPRDRHSASNAPRGRERESHSCPPLSRCQNVSSIGRTSAREEKYRELSCPPSLSRDLDAEQPKGRKNRTVTSSKTMKKSKDLVSKTASRSRIFGSMRKAGKVIPAPNVM
jgi:hypothetical protein